LAEDHAVNQKVALQILQRMGYRADVAGNGIEVLEALQRQPYDVVLMDMQMPEMDGIEATERIRQDWATERSPYIIAMTANAMQGDREACIRAGMDDYISKPIRIQKLAEALTRCPSRTLVAATVVSSTPEASAVVSYEAISRNGSGLSPIESEHRASAGELPAPAKAIDPSPMVWAADQEPILDEQILDSLREVEVLDEAIELYLRDSPMLLTKVKIALDSGNIPHLKDAAHSLKSTSGTMGAVLVYQTSQQLESAAKQGDLQAATHWLPAVEREHQRAISRLQAIPPTPELTEAEA